ncbi:hypothetical protein PIIN_11854 [Serendipita indica DSM 11827]|uniref:Uncharacterized protein n=1 Tax=Serendipita indica (strain DSM 11827) TaxID=1109443 RepID=G4TH88_SERID|nr:hypothetical protein PIIN_11854 [Serendipita indica DSM 11827]
MQLGYTILNLVLLWVNSWATFKTLNRRHLAAQKTTTRGSRMQQRSKREMKTCLSVWVVWVTWRYIERVVDHSVGILIPFLHEIKCLVLIFLIIARSWATEPLVLQVLRPAIKPYVGLIDTTLHWLEMGGDFMFLLICLPYHLFMSWWNGTDSKGEENSIKLEVDLEINAPQKPASQPVTPDQPTNAIEPDVFAGPALAPLPVFDTVPISAQEAADAHRKEQEEQEKEEARIREIQERSARDRASHLRRVAGPPPSALNNNTPSSRSLQAALQSSKAASNTDLPESSMNTGSIVNKRPPNQIHVPMPAAPRVVRRQPSRDGSADDSSQPPIYPHAALIMPVPVRAQRAPARPAVHVNASVSIPRPNNPAPSVPSVVVRPSVQTLPRPPRPQPLQNPISRTVGGKSSDTLVSSSTSSSASVNEFGVSVHRREAANDDSSTVDGESQDSNAKSRRWDDFVGSIQQQHQRHDTDADTIEATRRTAEMVQRITDMKKEVDEKLQRISERAGAGKGPIQVPIIRKRVATPATKPSVVFPTKQSLRHQPSEDAMTVDETIASTSQVGHKRGRKPGDSAGVSETEEPRNNEQQRRSPKKRRVDLDAVDVHMDVDTATMVTESTAAPEGRTTRSTRIVVQRKPSQDTMSSQAPPTRTGAVRSTRTVQPQPTETTAPSATRVRTRRTVVS